MSVPEFLIPILRRQLAAGDEPAVLQPYPLLGNPPKSWASRNAQWISYLWEQAAEYLTQRGIDMCSDEQRAVDPASG
ncbi:hypothetical protein GCM10009526_26030 [Glutamicibacter creatinolyticus]